MTIPSVVQGTVEFAGKIFELDSPRGATWLESVTSFRFEPATANKPYTVRKEAGKSGDYWYGYRKMSGRLHKKYIGRSSELNTAKLEEIAEALNTPPQSRVTGKVTEVTDTTNQGVTDRVTDTVTIEEFTALKSQVQSLQESLEALLVGLPGKSDAGDFEELPAVTDSKLQIEIGNLRDENEALRAELAEIRSQLATVQATASATASPELKLPEASDMLNKLKAKRKKSSASLADVEAILEMIEKSW
ncbi:hypothetical protein C7B69_12285 [filamentous cyanobacterium Phorm 46]|nr:hypothetical protein C7B69_12285 [filamentous cyanobacterium Phorm 46]